jgi:TolA-binding protein
MNLEPTKFERTILDLERQRFGIKNIYDIDDIPKERISSFGQGPIKKAKQKRNIEDLYYDTSGSKGTFTRLSRAEGFDQDINRSPNNSFDRYKNDLCYKKKSMGARLSVEDPAHISSTPQIGKTRKRSYFESNLDTASDYEVEKKLSQLNKSQDFQKKTRFKDPVEEHREFRDHAYEEVQPDMHNRIRRAIITPNEEVPDIHSSHTHFTSNYDDNVNFSNREVMNSYIRKFLFKELEKIRHECRENNNLLSQNIASNEEFYSKKYDDLKNQVRGHYLSSSDAQIMIDESVTRKLAQTGLKDEQKKGKEGVSKLQAQINSLVAHYNTGQDQINKLNKQIDEMSKRFEGMERDQDLIKRTTSHKLDVLEKGLNNVKEDCIANSDSFMVSVESRLDDIEQRLGTQELKKKQIKKVAILEQPRVSDPLVEALRKDVNLDLDSIEKRIMNLEADAQKQFNINKELDNKLNKINKADMRSIKELADRINEVRDQVDSTDMEVNKKFNMLKTTAAPSAPVTKNNIDKNLENRMTRCETLIVRHGKTLDALTEDVNNIAEQEPKVVIHEKTNPCN